MKTLKEELQIIVDKNLLNSADEFICCLLSRENKHELQKHKHIASNYAKKFWQGGFTWWNGYHNQKDTQYVISEKYRFIEDLIKTL